MRLRKLLARLALIAAGTMLAGILPPAAGAQTPFRPVAIVNDAVITGFDLAQRAQLLAALSSRNASPESLRNAALDQLVEDRLKLQAAKQMGIAVGPDVVQAGIEDLARQAGMQPDDLRSTLAARGISEQALEDMARANMAWLQVVRARFANRIEPSPAEIDSELAKLRDEGQTEYRILEIGLPLEGDGRSEAETRALADRLYAELSGGGSFEQAVARYSRAPSAARGGEVGWVTTERMPPELSAAIRGLEVGAVSPPLPVSGGIALLKLSDKRSTGTAPAVDESAREAVRNELILQRGTRLADGLLQEMRRDALIEVR